LPGSPLRVHRMNFMPDARQIQLQGLFISAKRHSIARPDRGFADFKESILGMYLPPRDSWTEAAWRALDEIWDGRLLTPQPWFALPAVRALCMSSPAYAREIRGLRGLRPWSSFLAANAIGRKADEPEPRIEVVVAQLERDPQKWSALPWRFASSGDPLALNRLDREGVRWRLRTLRDLLQSYAMHSIPEMLAPDGARCGPYTRGVLRRRPIRDGERWLVLKEAAVYGDDPRYAFSVQPSEAFRRATQADQGRDDASPIWDEVMRPAFVIVGPATVARKMELAERTGRAWAAGARRPENPGEVARAIVAVAHAAGLSLPTDEHLRAEEICRELPHRAAAVQCFIAIAVEMLAERHDGVRGLARAMAKQGGDNSESTLRRWLGLAHSERRSIAELNRIVARLSKFSRTEIKSLRRRIRSEPGPAGDRQAILAHISLLDAADKPIVPKPEEALAFPVIFVIVGLLVALVQQIAETLRSSDVHAQLDCQLPL
jgi:hypothetical protein